MNEFSMKLKQFRWSQDMTIREFADSLNMNHFTYACYEKGNRKPSLRLLKELALVYNIDLNEWVLGV